MGKLRKLFWTDQTRRPSSTQMSPYWSGMINLILNVIILLDIWHLNSNVIYSTGKHNSDIKQSGWHQKTFNRSRDAILADILFCSYPTRLPHDSSDLTLSAYRTNLILSSPTPITYSPIIYTQVGVCVAESARLIPTKKSRTWSGHLSQTLQPYHGYMNCKVGPKNYRTKKIITKAISCQTFPLYGSQTQTGINAARKIVNKGSRGCQGVVKTGGLR